MSFSFKYLTDHDKFSFGHWDCAGLWNFITRLKNLCGVTIGEIITGGRSYRFHQITWSDTSERGFVHLPEHLRELDAYQLEISQNGGRFHGFVIGDVFHIVWMDRQHLLYTGRR